MQLSSVLLGAFAIAASALPQTPVERRSYTYTSTVSDPGFYAWYGGVDDGVSYFEDTILQWFNPTTSGPAALVARFPVGFAVTQNRPVEIDVYTRTSAGIGQKFATAPALTLVDGKVTEAVDVVLAELAYDSSYVFEFRIKVNDTNTSESISWLENESAGYFLRTGSSY